MTEPPASDQPPASNSPLLHILAESLSINLKGLRVQHAEALGSDTITKTKPSITLHSPRPLNSEFWRSSRSLKPLTELWVLLPPSSLLATPKRTSPEADSGLTLASLQESSPSPRCLRWSNRLYPNQPSKLSFEPPSHQPTGYRLKACLPLVLLSSGLPCNCSSLVMSTEHLCGLHIPMRMSTRLCDAFHSILSLIFPSTLKNCPQTHSSDETEVASGYLAGRPAQAVPWFANL